MQSFRQNSRERIFFFLFNDRFVQKPQMCSIRQIYLINWYVILKYKTKDVIQKK